MHNVIKEWLRKLNDAPSHMLRAHRVPMAVHEELVRVGWSKTESDAEGVVWESLTDAGLAALRSLDDSGKSANASMEAVKRPMDFAEISNPSDPYTIAVGDDPKPVYAAVLLLGEGQYGLKGAAEMPIFCFGGHEPWLRERGIDDIGRYCKEHKAEIAEALDTVLVGPLGERKAFERAMAEIKDPEGQRRARAAWSDQKRSSMKDIGRRAAELAKALRSLE